MTDERPHASDVLLELCQLKRFKPGSISAGLA